jgi:hypothetical protein
MALLGIQTLSAAHRALFPGGRAPKILEARTAQGTPMYLSFPRATWGDLERTLAELDRQQQRARTRGGPKARAQVTQIRKRHIAVMTILAPVMRPAPTLTVVEACGQLVQQPHAGEQRSTVA